MYEITCARDKQTKWCLKGFEQNRMCPLYKEDKIVYTLDKMKTFYDVAQNSDDNFTYWTTYNFEDKLLKFFQEMTRVEKWIANFTRIKSNINLKLIN